MKPRSKDLLVKLVVADQEAMLAADRLWTAGATAVEEREADPAPGSVTLLAGFPTGEAARLVSDSLRASLVEVDDSWRDGWKEFAAPVEVSTLVVVPAWRSVQVGDGRLALSIDPGGCFGSGTHATTRLLLAELADRVTSGSAVFDVGTGSGILAVAAALLGAGRVVAVDVDPDAVRVARSNALANGVGALVEVSTAPPSAVAGPFDLVVANLTAATLGLLSDALIGATGPGGLLLLSGMLPGQWEHVADRFASLAVIEVPVLDGWVGAVLRN